MPPYANMKRPKTPVIRSGLGVAQGGQVGRPPTLHMGTASARSGGVNARGSMTTFAKAAGAKPAALKLGKVAKPAYKTLKAPPKKTPPLKPALPANPAAPLGIIDPRDSQYGLDAARNLYDYETGTAGIPVMQKQFELGAYDLQRGRDRSQYDSNAALAARGVYNSGGRINADVDIANDYTRDYYGLRAELGDIAQKALTTQYGGARTIADNQAYYDAMNRYEDNNLAPTAPIQQTVNANTTSGALTGWTGGNAWFSRGPGVWGFINQNGQWVNAKKNPPAGARVIANPLRKF